MAASIPISKLFALGLGVILLASCGTKKLANGESMVAIMEVKEPIPGVCDNEKVYALAIMSLMDSSTKNAKCATSEADMAKKLNAEVPFLKANPDFSGKGMMSIIVNCKGEAVRYEIDNKSESPELDDQILTVFKTFTDWKAGNYNGKPVDSVQLFSYTVKDGVLVM